MAVFVVWCLLVVGAVCGCTWTPLGEAEPEGREFSAGGHVVQSSLDGCVVFGGLGADDSLANQTWVYMYASAEWNRLDDAPIDSSLFGHAGVPKGEDLWIYGGAYKTAPDIPINTVKKYCPTMRNWWPIDSSGPCSKDHAAVIYNGKLYTFGGTDGADPCNNDFYTFNLTSCEWAHLTFLSDEIPSPRTGHAATIIGSKMYISGGNCGDTFYNDMWNLDLDSLKWIQMDSPLKPRTHHSMTATLDLTEIVVFGGQSSDGQLLDDTWVFHVNKETWENLQTPQQPPSLQGALMAPGLNSGSVYLTGGCTLTSEDGYTCEKFQNQLWELTC
ncbi:Negative regulator of mitotic exit [Pelomyxa schiedti]|nr:Negative regulator of mitotic exit [Pelomyxa schiedti]